MAPKKIDRVSILESLDLAGIRRYLRELLRETGSEGILFYAKDIEALIKAINQEIPPDGPIR
jgi:hypothetical protein